MARDTQHGFTLVESLIALAILGAVVAGVATMIGNTEESLSRHDVLATQQELAQVVERAMQQYDNVVHSAMAFNDQGNLMLRNCLGRGTGPCTVTDPAAQVPLRFAQKKGNRTLAGTPAAPINHSRRGTRGCRQGEALCPFWTVSAYFYATCPPAPPANTPAATCRQASTIHLRFQVSPRFARYRNHPLKALPPNPDFNANPERFVISHRTYQSTQVQPCPPNTDLVGWLGSGRPDCRCRFNQAPTGTDANGFPICPSGNQVCDKDEMLQGRDRFGKPICARFAIHCTTIQLGSNAAEGRCPNGGWLEGINLGVCRAAPRSKKAGHRKISCSQNQGTCCYYAPL